MICRSELFLARAKGYLELLAALRDLPTSVPSLFIFRTFDIAIFTRNYELGSSGYWPGRTLICCHMMGKG